jgi:hypothetical protein
LTDSLTGKQPAREGQNSVQVSLGHALPPVPLSVPPIWNVPPVDDPPQAVWANDSSSRRDEFEAFEQLAMMPIGASRSPTRRLTRVKPRARSSFRFEDLMLTSPFCRPPL